MSYNSPAEDVAPLKDGMPNLYVYMPTRFVPLQEAKERGWKWYYIGEVCSHGHKAPRYVSNPRQCVDCRRIADGNAPIGGKGAKEYVQRPRGTYTQPASTDAGTAVPRPLEPNAREKAFLAKYAELKNFDAAAKALNSNPAVFHATLSFSKVFRDAVSLLEDSLGLTRTPTDEEDFVWDDDKRAILIRVYINTGDMGIARDAIQVSNYHFQRELQENDDFARALEEAEPLAHRILDENAIRKAIQGDSKLLSLTLAAKLPEYGPKLNVNMKVTEKLTDDQLNARAKQVFRLLLQQNGGELPAPAIDAEFSDVGPPGEAEGTGDDRGEDPAQLQESNLDLL